MTEPVSTTKLVAGMLAAAAAVPAATEAIMAPERMILGAPQSVLLVAIAGVLIGVMLLPEKEAERVRADASLMRGPRALQLAARVSALVAVVLGYALIAAWVVAFAAYWFPPMQGAPQLPLAGISGVSIRRMLPNYLRVIERITGAIGGRT